MSGPEFFRTGMGRIFYESTMPTIAKALEAIAKRMEPAPSLMTAEEAQLMRRDEQAERGTRISAMAATIAAGISTREHGALEIAEKAVEIAIDIERLVAIKIGAGQ